MPNKKQDVEPEYSLPRRDEPMPPGQRRPTSSGERAAAIRRASMRGEAVPEHLRGSVRRVD